MVKKYWVEEFNLEDETDLEDERQSGSIEYVEVLLLSDVKEAIEKFEEHYREHIIKNGKFTGQFWIHVTDGEWNKLKKELGIDG